MAPSTSAQPVKLSLPLEYQQAIFNQLRTQDALVVIARGLGLLKLVTNLLHSYDAAGGCLILVIGADERENGWIGEALAEHAAISRSPKARGLTVVNTDLTGVPARQKLYQQGGIFSITSRILVVDLLTGLLDPETVTGAVVLHAERVVATSLEAFILRIYRQRNRKGFLKAFADTPDAFVRGWDPLAAYMRNLFLSKVSLWPRFQVQVARSLEGRRKAEVIELEVPMSDAMADVQAAVLECAEASVLELRRANAGLLDVDEWNLDAGVAGEAGRRRGVGSNSARNGVNSLLLRNFDLAVRAQLDPHWHRLSPKTKQIVADLTVLRGMLNSIVSLDAVSFLKHLDAIHAAHSPPPGTTKHTQSPWLFLDAAQTIFETAKERVYRQKAKTAVGSTAKGQDILASVKPVLEEQPKWAVLAEVLDEIDYDMQFNPAPVDDSNGTILIVCQDVATCRQLRDYLETMYVKPHEMESAKDESDSAANSDPDERHKPSAALMMRRNLRDYLAWKKTFARVNHVLFSEAASSVRGAVDPRTRLAAGSKARPPPNKRRRVRGGGNVGGPAPSHQLVSSGGGFSRTETGALALPQDSTAEVASLLSHVSVGGSGTAEAAALAKSTILSMPPELVPANHDNGDGGDDDEEAQRRRNGNDDAYFHLYDPASLVVIHAYDGDADDRVLEETKPRYVVMYDPSAAFVRRIETYRSSHSDQRSVRVYFMYYGGSVEEQRYLSDVRREKDNFTRLIKERASMSLVIDHQTPGGGITSSGGSENVQEAFLRTINTRIAGGGQVRAAPGSVTDTPPRVVVDVREFRSTLPSLLHAGGLIVVPCMLTVGDYILSPAVCVERKSIPDLVGSFKDGRLYAQCESMFAHYASPVLLIEFDQDKAFSLEPFAVAEYSASATTAASAGGAAVLPSAKNVAVAAATAAAREGESAESTSMAAASAPNIAPDLQSKLVLLTLAFPKLRILWSSSPYQTTEMFKALKALETEPDPIAAVRAGTGDNSSGTGGTSSSLLFNPDPRDMLATVPGVTPQNINILMREFVNIKQIANTSRAELAPLVGTQSARQIEEFFSRDICQS